MGVYDTAQICLNGDVVTDWFHRSPEHRQKFCDKCGQATIHQCPGCGVEIRGHYHVENVVVIGGRKPKAPLFCLGCGKPYPWTAAKIYAAKAMAHELTGLSEDERIMLKASIDDIAVDSPMTQVAVRRFKRLIPKM